MSDGVSRPRSVTIILWVLIILGGLGVVTIRAAGDTVGENVVAPGFIGGLISVVCGGAMLARQNWARMIYICITPYSFMAEGIAMGFAVSQVVQLTLYGVVVYFLTRQAASKYFGGPLFAGRSGSATR